MAKVTPDDIDWLFDRDIVEEEDYVYFWSEYWKRGFKGREELVQEFIDMAGEGGQGENLSLGAVYKDDEESAKKQAQALNETTDMVYHVVRRNASGKFSKRGHFYQAIRLVLPKRKK